MIKTCITTAAKLALLRSELKPTHRLKMALYGPTASLGPKTKVYSPAGEVKGTNYEHKDLPKPEVSEDDNSAYYGFSGKVVWLNSTIEAAGALIYDADLDNLAVFVIEFPDLVRSTNHEFVVELSEKFFKL